MLRASLLKGLGRDESVCILSNLIVLGIYQLMDLIAKSFWSVVPIHQMKRPYYFSFLACVFSCLPRSPKLFLYWCLHSELAWLLPLSCTTWGLLGDRSTHRWVSDHTSAAVSRRTRICCPSVIYSRLFSLWNAPATLVKSQLALNSLFWDSVLSTHFYVCPGDRTTLLWLSFLMQEFLFCCCC